ncbi:acetyl-CoA synthetase-like protein [Xylariaceae sp. FL0804]|nr:acetyl-CoA synthetase-like protein [Xylariaceae sp. FL0804]
MTSTVETTPEGTIYKPAEVLDVPNVDLMTLLFDSEITRVDDDKVIHLDADEPAHHLTKGQLRRQSKRAAQLFRSRYGVGAAAPYQDVVFVVATGHFMLPLVFYGAITAGGIFSSTNPSATPDELAYQLRQTSARLLICTPDTRESALAGARRAGLPDGSVLVLGGTEELELREATTTTTGSGSGSGATMMVPLPREELDWRRVTDPDELRRSVICILFSSGTTGLPKAMPLSHRNSVASCALALQPIRDWQQRRRREAAGHQQPAPEQVTLAHLPAAHIAGVQGYLVNATYGGGRCYWMAGRFDFARFCAHARRYGVTNMFTVPPIYLLIAKSPLVRDHFDAWEEAVSGAAPMGQELQLEVRRKLGRGGTALRQTWGLSETCGSITIVPIELAHSAPPGCVGALIPSCYARIVDDDDKDVKPGEPGEIWVKGPVVTEGYWRNEKATKDAFRDGWFCTGDIGIFRDGWFFIVDRKKELIKYKGNQVAPAELEAMLLSHPKILDAAVIGVHGEGTEVPRAYVVADPKQITGDEITKWFSKQGLSHYKQLRGGVVFLEAIPKSPSGKILRKVLRDLAKKDTVSAKI